MQARLDGNPAALSALAQREATGSEPDVIGHDEASGSSIFCDCSPESPTGRRSICHDRAALDARKENKPRCSAEDMAAEMGVTLLT